jgi:hypothetical protein
VLQAFKGGDVDRLGQVVVDAQGTEGVALAVVGIR